MHPAVFEVSARAQNQLSLEKARLEQNTQRAVQEVVLKIETLQAKIQKIDRALKVLDLQLNLLKKRQALEPNDTLFDASVWQQDYWDQLDRLSVLFVEDYEALVADRLKTPDIHERDRFVTTRLNHFKSAVLDPELAEYRAFSMEPLDWGNTIQALECQKIALHCESDALVTESTQLQEAYYYDRLDQHRQDEATLIFRFKQSQQTLHAACEQGALERVQALVQAQKKSQRKAFLEQFSEAGLSPLQTACLHGHRLLVVYLLQMGVNVHQRSHEASGSGTVMHFAVYQLHSDTIEILRLLVDAGVDLNAQDRHGRTALHVASESGVLEAVEWLIKRGISLDLQTNNAQYRRSSLHIAAFRGYEAVVRHLLKKGAHPFLLNTHAETPFVEALLMNHSAVLQTFMEEGVYLSHRELLQLLKHASHPEVILSTLERLLTKTQGRLQPLQAQYVLASTALSDAGATTTADVRSDGILEPTKFQP